MMINYIFLCVFIITQFAFAQNRDQDLENIQTLNTQVYPFNLPLYIDLEGQLSLITRNIHSPINLTPLAHFLVGGSTSVFVLPMRSDKFYFSMPRLEIDCVEIKKNIFEFGPGLNVSASALGGSLMLGLLPYKGARQVMIRKKISCDEVTQKPKLPKKLSELDSWRVGDSGSFQRYGGIQISVGANYSGFIFLGANITIQNLFNLRLSKVAEQKIVLSINEEDMNRRSFQGGALVGAVETAQLTGKIFSSEFILDLENKEHHELYEMFLNGKIHVLQEKIPLLNQKIKWRGNEQYASVGIPYVIGKYAQHLGYEMNWDQELEEQSKIDIRASGNTGFLLPLRDHNHIIYQTESSIFLLWASEMGKATHQGLQKRFLGPAMVMGAEGFDQSVPGDLKLGRVSTQLVVEFTRKNFEELSIREIDDLLNEYQFRCQELKLSCSNERRFKKIEKSLKNIFTQNWNEARYRWGFLLMDEPALIYAYNKVLDLDKKLFYKILGSSFQSMEGMAVIKD